MEVGAVAPVGAEAVAGAGIGEMVETEGVGTVVGADTEEGGVVAQSELKEAGPAVAAAAAVETCIVGTVVAWETTAAAGAPEPGTDRCELWAGRAAVAGGAGIAES